MPYTETGIRRVKCYRCKARPATQQWNICADAPGSRIYRAVCTECDIDLNRLVLDWLGDPEIEAKMRAYESYLREMLAN